MALSPCALGYAPSTTTPSPPPATAPAASRYDIDEKSPGTGYAFSRSYRCPPGTR
jgi:hypothetical protein